MNSGERTHNPPVAGSIPARPTLTLCKCRPHGRVARRLAGDFDILSCCPASVVERLSSARSGCHRHGRVGCRHAVARDSAQRADCRKWRRSVTLPVVECEQCPQDRVGGQMTPKSSSVAMYTTRSTVSSHAMSEGRPPFRRPSASTRRRSGCRWQSSCARRDVA